MLYGLPQFLRRELRQGLCPAAGKEIGVCNPAILYQIPKMPQAVDAYRLFFFGG